MDPLVDVFGPLSTVVTFKMAVFASLVILKMASATNKTPLCVIQLTVNGDLGDLSLDATLVVDLDSELKPAKGKSLPNIMALIAKEKTLILSLAMLAAALSPVLLETGLPGLQIVGSVVLVSFKPATVLSLPHLLVVVPTALVPPLEHPGLVLLVTTLTALVLILLLSVTVQQHLQLTKSLTPLLKNSLELDPNALMRLEPLGLSTVIRV
jgi:hypothetical protein